MQLKQGSAFKLKVEVLVVNRVASDFYISLAKEFSISYLPSFGAFSNGCGFFSILIQICEGFVSRKDCCKVLTFCFTVYRGIRMPEALESGSSFRHPQQGLIDSTYNDFSRITQVALKDTSCCIATCNPQRKKFYILS